MKVSKIGTDLDIQPSWEIPRQIPNGPQMLKQKTRTGYKLCGHALSTLKT